MASNKCYLKACDDGVWLSLYTDNEVVSPSLLKLNRPNLYRTCASTGPLDSHHSQPLN